MSEYKLVPVEPTAEMLAAGKYALEAGCYASGIYADMLAAAPDVQVSDECPRCKGKGRYATGPIDCPAMTICKLCSAPAVQGEAVAWQVINIKYPKVEPATHNRYPDWAEGDQDLKINPLYAAPQPAEQQPECGCCGQTDRCDDDCDTVVIGGNRAAEQKPDCVYALKPEDLIIQGWSNEPPSQWIPRLESGVKITHVPSGISATCDTERSPHANRAIAMQELERRLEKWKPAPDVADYEQVLDDHRRLTRELDVLLNGEEGAAQQASLADLVAQLRTVVRNTGKPVLDAPDVAGLVEALEACRDELLWMIERHNQQDQNDGSWLYDHQTVVEAYAALAAHRKQEPSHDNQ